MISISTTWIVLVALFVLDFLILCILSKIRLQKNPLENSTFMRVFPSELMDYKLPGSSIFRPILFSYSAICFLPIIIIVPNMNDFGDVGIVGIITSIAFGIEGIVLVSLFLFHIRYTSAHTKLASVFMAGSFLLSVLTSTYCGLTYKMWLKFDHAQVITLVYTIVSGVIALIILLLMANPKLRDWARLSRTEDGTEALYKRPKRFPLAYTEWALILLNFVSELIFILSLVR